MQTNQKERWAARASRYEASAAKKLAEAERLHERREYEGDVAFWTQPGRIVAREQMHRRMDRAAALREEAKRAAEKAANLRAMASRNKGDAERDRNARRDDLAVAVGDTVRTLYGDLVVTKVNAKTIRVEGVSSAIDKSLVKVVSA